MRLQDLSALGGFFHPYVDGAIVELERVIAYPSMLNDHLSNSLRAGLNREYYELTHRTLIANYKLIERTVTFATYANALSDDETRRYILSRYPVLSRWMDEFASRWVRNTAYLLNNLAKDRGGFSRISPDITDTCTLISIGFGLGDRHRGGKSVAMLRFDNGARLIFKPRPLAIDGHIQTLLTFISENTDLDLRVPKHLDFGEHGWVEFVEHRACDDRQDVALYFRRLGALLAILYVLEASDFHYENIIACGSQPMLVDLEAVCHPRSPILAAETNEDSDSTILRTGLLPRRIAIGDSIGSDISGMTDVEGQQGVIERLVLLQSDDGDLSFKRERGTLLGAQNVPMLGTDKVVTDPALAAQFADGFSTAYDAMSGQTAQLTRLIERFATAEVRVIFRATLAYTHLLDEARHPALLLSESEMLRHFHGLEGMSIDYPLLGELVDDELVALQQRDVPVFSCRVGSRDLILNGERTKPDFFLASGLEAVKRRIASLSTADRDRQLWIIDKALEISSDNVASKPDAQAVMPNETVDTPHPGGDELANRLLAQAEIIGRLVTEQIYQDETEASWLVVKPTNKENTTASVWNATYDLYGGMPGEILFLDQLANITGERNYAGLADKALAYLEHRIRKSSGSIKPLGYLAGWGSLIDLATSLGLSRDDERFFDQAREMIAYVSGADLVAVDGNFSLTKGSAGLILACAHFSAATGCADALPLAERAYDHLMTHRHDVTSGYGWRIASERALSGLAHGASGFAVAFAKMFAVTGQERYREACLRSLEFERTLFDASENNWTDQRDIVAGQDGPRCSMSWAHGAPGIGIARLAILQAGIENPDILDDLHIAVRTTLEAPTTSSFSIISGDFGRLELPVLFAERYGGGFWHQTEPMMRAAVTRLEDHTRRLGTGGRPPLGMFSGITGVGYQCLRFAKSRDIPSLAGLEPYSSRVQTPLGGADDRDFREPSGIRSTRMQTSGPGLD